MPPQQTCCCKDGEEPCPNCWEKAAFGCQPPCCWCNALEGLCEDDIAYGQALGNCNTNWNNTPASASPCSDTFNVNIQIPDEIEVNIGPNFDEVELNYPLEKTWIGTTTFGDLSFSTVNCAEVKWLTSCTGRGPVFDGANNNKAYGFVKKNTARIPPRLPDQSHVGLRCAANDVSSCNTAFDSPCTSNIGYCCEDCSGDGDVGQCTYVSPFQFGYMRTESDFETQTTTFWLKAVEDTDITVTPETRDSHSPCCYRGISGTVATGNVVYLGLRNKVSSSHWMDPNCPSENCNCAEEECQDCLHCQSGANSACTNCQDVRCVYDDTDIDWSDVVDHADFDIYTVPINWKIEYQLRAEDLGGAYEDSDRYIWTQQVIATWEEDWTGITVDPATQQLTMAPTPIKRSYLASSPLDRDCYTCGDDTPSCQDCDCSGCALEEHFSIGHPLRAKQGRDNSSLTRCQFHSNEGYSSGNMCRDPGIFNCETPIGPGKKYNKQAQVWNLNSNTGSVSWSVPWTYYVQNTQCLKTASGTSAVWFSLLDYGIEPGTNYYTNSRIWACKSCPRISSCSQKCPTCTTDGGIIPCTWEDGGFVVTVTGLDPS
mgnify:CR=1 FL=1